MSQLARIKIIKNLINNAQTVPLMNTVSTPKVNSAPPVPKTPAPVVPVNNTKSNVVQPPQQNQNNTPVPQNTIQTTPVIKTNEPTPVQQPVQQPGQQQEEQGKEANIVYELVKKAIENKKNKILNAKYYYETMDYFDSEIIKNKTYAAIDINGIMKFAKIDNKESIIDNKLISLYEPVISKTNSFIVKLFDKDFSKIVEVSNKISNLNINTVIYKFADRYEIKCNSEKHLDTKLIFSYIEGITNAMKTNLDNLKIGKLKRLSFSLDKEGKEGTLISIG